MNGLTGRQLINGVFKGEYFEQVPIWFMRQAGRYLPEYMELKKKYRTFEERCMNPEIAKDITIQPIDRFDLDAAVIFSDILIPIYDMKLGLEIKPGIGPSIEKPIRTAKDVDNMIITTAKENFSYQSEAIKLVRKELAYKAIVGFSGAPFTLASYLIEGKSTRDALITKSFAISKPASYEKLLSNLTEIIIDQLQVQVEAGADFLQIFDSWVGFLSPTQFRMWAKPYLTKIFNAFPDIPTIFYARGTSHLFQDILETGPTGINVDNTLSLTAAHEISPNKLLQGNLDPAILLTNTDIVSRETAKILQEIDKLDHYRYIFNLSTGINKSSKIENVAMMVNTVKSFRRHNQ